MSELTFSRKPYEWTKTEVRVSPVSQPDLAGMSAFVVRTGSMTLQAYITADELRKLSAVLIRAADDLDETKLEVA